MSAITPNDVLGGVVVFAAIKAWLLVPGLHGMLYVYRLREGLR